MEAQWETMEVIGFIDTCRIWIGNSVVIQFSMWVNL